MKKFRESGPGFGIVIRSRTLAKLWKMTRLTVLLILLGMGQAFALSSYAQSTTLNLKFKNASLEEVLAEIEDQSEFFFLYNKDLIDVEQKVDVEVRNKKINEILNQLLEGKEIRYFLFDRQIVLSNQYGETGISGQENMTVQQQRTVSGTVTDESGEPLPGVTVVVKGTTRGTVTNADGNYSLSNIPEDATLQFSFVGMLTKEVEVGNQSTIDVTMVVDAIGIEEVVAIGYGVVKKSDLTGSVSQVKSEDINAYPALGMTQAMQGRASGVQITANNGEPGSSFKVRIRGATSINSSSDPLYVVDGFPGAVLPPPEDIESIEILKDASATAIYGSRGANGVIMVTTKHGTSGATKIELNSSYSVQNEINRLDLLGKDDFITYLTEIDPAALDGTLIDPVGTDWQEEVFRTGQIHNHQLSFRGGNDNVKYYLSGSVFDQQGIVINSNYKRYSLTSNIDLNVSEKFNMGLGLFARRTIKNGVKTQESSGGVTGAGVIGATFQMEPTLPIYDAEGNYAISWLGQPNDNPVALANELVNEPVDDRLQVNLFGEYALLPDLKFKATLGANINNGRNGNYTPTTLNGGKQTGGDGRVSGSKYTGLISENYLTFTKDFGNHDISAMGGYSYQFTESTSWSGHGQMFITDAFDYWALGQSSVWLAPGSGITTTELTSIYSRVNYKLLDRYMITVNARYDGSSRFAKNNKWAFFPSGEKAWNIAEETFFDDFKTVGQLKRRASSGVTGTQAMGPYQELAKMRTVHSVQNSSVVNAVRPNAVANDNLTWESTEQTNIGIDLGLFEQRIYLNADYYYMKTTDLLFGMPLPEYSGFSSMLKNIGILQNQGVDIALSTVNIDRDFRWTTDINFSLNRNEILELPEGNDIRYNVIPGHMVGIQNTNIMREGEPLGVYYGYVYDGVIQEGEEIIPGNWEKVPGGEKYKDINGTRDENGDLTGEPDGKLNGDDRTIIGNPNPDFIYGINNTFTYKNFDLNIFLQGSYGNDMYSFTLMELETLRGEHNTTSIWKDRWTPSNTDTDVPMATYARGYHTSSRWIFDGSYLRVKNIALGYNLPKSAVDRIGLEAVRLYLSGQNFLTFTNYRGYDPEVNYKGASGSSANKNLGFDYASYPNSKSYTFGLRVTF